MKKKFCYLFSLMLLFTLFLSGPVRHVEAASKQESLNTSVKTFMKHSKNFNLKGIRSYVNSFGIYKMTYSSIDMDNNEMYRYLKKCNKKMTYKVVSKKQNKKTATVKLKIKYVNSYQFTEKLTENMVNDILSGTIDPETMTEEEMLQYVNKLVKKAQASVTKTKYRTQTITLKFIKKGKKWKVKKMTKALDNILEANIPYSLEKLLASLM